MKRSTDVLRHALADARVVACAPPVHHVRHLPINEAPIAQRIKDEAAIATAVGWFITEPQQAEDMIASGQRTS